MLQRNSNVYKDKTTSVYIESAAVQFYEDIHLIVRLQIILLPDYDHKLISAMLIAYPVYNPA